MIVTSFSGSLDISVELPEINYDETWHISIDYKTETYQVEVEKAEVERLQNKFYLFFQKFQEMIEKADSSAKVQATVIVNFTGDELLEEH